MADLKRAITELGAEPRGRGRWIYHEHNGDPTRYVVDSAAMRDLGARLRRREAGAYSLWCAETTPERIEDRDDSREPRQ